MRQKLPAVHIEKTSRAAPNELLRRRRYAGAGLKGFVGRLALVLASLPLLIFINLPLLLRLYLFKLPFLFRFQELSISDSADDNADFVEDKQRNSH